MVKKAIVLIILFGSFEFVEAQEMITSEVCLPHTELFSKTAASNSVTYKIYVSLPPDYYTSSKEYPVLYLLDADYSFAMAKNISDHLSQRNQMRGLVIIGLAYDSLSYEVNRTRDYTPSNSEMGGYVPEIQKKYSGGAPLFQQFMKDELIPYVYDHYRVTEERTIVGHSFGGLFCAYTLLTAPELFTGYVIVSPSLWYDDHFLFRLDGQLAGELPSDTKVYLTVGDMEVNDQWNMPLDLEGFYSILNDRAVRKLHLKKSIEKQQTHHSIFPIGLTNGMRYVLDGR